MPLTITTTFDSKWFFYYLIIRNMLSKWWTMIPNSVLCDERLKDKDIRVYWIISSICSLDNECFAWNQYIVDKINVKRSWWDERSWKLTKETVSRSLANLKKYWYISLEYTYKEWTKEIESRTINLATPYWLINQYPIDYLVKENNNNIYNNNNNNNITISSHIKEKKKQIKKIFTLPSRSEIYSFMWEKKWVEKFCDILEDTNIQQDLNLESIKSIYDWMVKFFQEKYEWKIYTNKDWVFVWWNIIMDELDKFISHYSENQVEIKCIKSRIRKWITNSLTFNQKK